MAVSAAIACVFRNFAYFCSQIPAQMHPIWQKDIMYLKKVGPQRADALRKELRIFNYGDLIGYFPRKYADRSRVSRVADIREEGYVTLVGAIVRAELIQAKTGRTLLKATFKDESGLAELVWFEGAKRVEKALKLKEEVALFGKASLFNGIVQITHPEIVYANTESEASNVGKIVSFYPSGAKLERVGLDGTGFRQIMVHLMEEAAAHIPETLDDDIRLTHKLVSRKRALVNVHFPQSWEQLQLAQYRLKFEELFFFQLMLAGKRKKVKQTHPSPAMVQVGDYFRTFYEKHLPFELTNAQKRVVKEIRSDIRMPVQMNRLVQGDVGSGKTMVAMLAMLIAIDNGYQATMMAPTEILAEQHFHKISAYIEPLGLKAVRLVGSQTTRERKEALAALLSGEAHIAVGTHALIEETVQFKNLGLAVVDEQHKFGVMQRARLWKKADTSIFPHNLFMTATPIPRTLAMSLYGDLEVSVIDELPPGRKPIKTLQFSEKRRLEVFGMIKRELEAGRQAYVVYPLVEESEKLDLLAATEGFDKLADYFKNYQVGIVHGRMKPDVKEFEMQRFIQKKTQILVSTTVIEVGVDVPNATIMVIENAERFGLSGLHQLRGRVGRGGGDSYCVLMQGTKLSNEGKQRLAVMCETTDGFKIAEADLQLRGPGDFMGTRQSGVPEFSLANIVEDAEILATAREAAFALLEADPGLSLPEHAQTRAALALYIKKNGGAIGMA